MRVVALAAVLVVLAGCGSSKIDETPVSGPAPQRLSLDEANKLRPNADRANAESGR